MKRTCRITTNVVCLVLVTNCWNLNFVKAGRVEAHQEFYLNRHRSTDVHQTERVKKDLHTLENMHGKPSIFRSSVRDESAPQTINVQEVGHGTRIPDTLEGKLGRWLHRVKRSSGSVKTETESEPLPERPAVNKASVVISEGNSTSIQTNGHDTVAEDTLDASQETLENTDQHETANSNEGNEGESAKKDSKTEVPKLKEVQPPTPSGDKPADELDSSSVALQEAGTKTVGVSRTGAELSPIRGQNMTGNSTVLNPSSGSVVESPPSKGNHSLPVFYRNREQDVTSATICVSAILILMFGIILYSRMWQRRDQWLSMSVALGETEQPGPPPITPSKLSIKDVIDGKLKLIQAQFKRIQKRHGGSKIQKNGRYKRVRSRDDSVDKSGSEDEIYTR